MNEPLCHRLLWLNKTSVELYFIFTTSHWGNWQWEGYGQPLLVGFLEVSDWPLWERGYWTK